MTLLLKFILSFALLSAGVEADDKRLALVRRIQGLEQLPDSLSRQLRTITLMVVTKQKDYEVLLSGTDAPNSSIVDMVAVESEIGRKGRLYHIETRLLDVKLNKLISRASRDDIREEDLVRLYQGALESLFLPELKKKLPGSTNNKNDPNPSNENPTLKKKLPSTTQFNQPNHSALDFKQRLRELKSDAEEGIAKVAEQEDAKKVEKKPKKESPPSIAAPIKAQLSFNDKPMKKEKPKLALPSKHTLQAGYDSRQVDSDYFTFTTAKVQLLTLKAGGHFPLSLFRGRVAGSYDLAYSKAISAPIELPILYQIGVYASWLNPDWNTSIGLNRESSFFSNLTSPGEGIQTQTVSTTWIKLKSQMLVEIRGVWELEASYGLPVMVETNYLPLKDADAWKGSNLHLAITPPHSYKKWKATLGFDKINLTTTGEQPFILNESRMALSVKRSL
jgi:hypothetical protein